LEELVLEKTTHPTLPWADVIASLPSLHTLSITTMLCATSTNNLEGLKDAIRAAAPVVRTLKITCEGLVVYLREGPLLGVDDDPFFHSVKALYNTPVPCSETLRTYHNTGQQMALIGVNAPLQELFLEEGDRGPVGLTNIGPRCNETLNILRLKARETRLPRGVRDRFPNVLTTDLRVHVQSKSLCVCDWLLQEAPLSTQHLSLHIDVSPFLPDGHFMWNADCLTALPDLHTVRIICSHACLGTASVLSCLEHASATLESFTFETRYRAVPDVEDDTRFCTAWEPQWNAEKIEALEREETVCYMAAESMKRQRPDVKMKLILAVS
jgi:hypothetical protein